MENPNVDSGARTSAPPLPRPRARSGFSTALIGLSALSALALSVFLYWRLLWNDPGSAQSDQLQALKTQLEQKTAGITDEVTRQVDDELGAELQGLTQQSQAIDQRLQAMEAAVANLLTTPAQGGPVNTEDWSVAEARIMLRMADFRLRTEADVKGALELLRSADQRFAATGDARFVGVRAGIARDVLSLEALGDGVDVEGVYLTIEALKTALTDVLQGTSLAAPVQSAPETEQPAQDSAWDAFLARLTELARVRRVDSDSVRPIPEAEERVYLERSIRLALEQAQLALLRGEQEIFASSLNSAKNKLSLVPGGDTPGRVAFIAGLEPLLQVKIERKYPNLLSLETNQVDAVNPVDAQP